MIDPITSIAATVAASVVSDQASTAWREAINRLRNRNEGGQPADLPDAQPTTETAAPGVASNEAFSRLLEGYYAKVGKRADFSFYAALIAAILGYVIIAAGILVGIYRADDLALAATTTGAGIFSQVLALMFFRNRAEERKMMVSVLADLRVDAEQTTRTIRALDLLEQVQQPLLRDNLAAAIALELSGTKTDLDHIHSALRLFGALGRENGGRPGTETTTDSSRRQGDEGIPSSH